MRTFFVLLAVSSLAVRWADAGCGCAAHNGWAALADELTGAEHGHDHGDPTGPAFDHGCDGECGRAVYAGGVRVQTTGGAPVVPPVMLVDIALPAAPAGSVEGFSPSGLPPSRAALQVYRV